MEPIIKSPEECTNKELQQFVDLVCKGGEVESNGLRARVENAYKLIFIYLEEDCIAVGALKRPNNAYKARVFEKAGVPGYEDKHSFEIGYLYTIEAFRGKGLAGKIMSSIDLISSGDLCFATTREDNAAMHYLFNKFGYNRLGNFYKSNRGGHLLGLFVTK